MRRRAHGDVAVNLAATSLVANHWLYDGDPRAAEWIVRYVDGWRDRADANGGLLPDNVGPDGVVGSLQDGQLVRRPLRLDLAARPALRRHGRADRRDERRDRHRRPRLPRARPGSAGHGDRPRDHRVGRGDPDEPPGELAEPARRGCRDAGPARPAPLRRGRLVRLRPDPDGASDLAVVVLARARRPRATPSAHVGAARVAHRGEAVPRQGGGRSRHAVAQLPRRRESRLPRARALDGARPGRPPRRAHGDRASRSRRPSTSTSGSACSRSSPRCSASSSPVRRRCSTTAGFRSPR